MTLLQLINRARETGNMFSTWDIPVKLNGNDVDITFTPEGSNETGYVIRMNIE